MTVSTTAIPDTQATKASMEASSDPLTLLSPAVGQLIRGRRSVRRYQPQPVPQAALLALLEAARWAPSAHNRQPWRFCVVTSTEAKTELSRRMSARWQQDLSADGTDPEWIARRIAISHARLTGSPALIVPSVTLEDMDVYPDVQRNEAEYIMAVQSVALACQNLLLAVHDLGLGASWLCAPLFAPELVRDVLDLPDHWQPQAILTVGYPAEHKEKDRAPLAGQVVWR
jgi:coenzyme F420-0:L-glutamate ligase / coenzyme F420-1:gamma-L-glutamate ligase